MQRLDLEGLTITDDDGNVAAINGVPEEGNLLSLQWTYRGTMVLCSLPAGLTKDQVVSELLVRMDTISDRADTASLIGEVL